MFVIILPNVLRLTVPQIMDQAKGAKRSVKILYKFYQKYFVVHDELSAVKNSFNTYLRMLHTGRSILIESVRQMLESRIT